MRAVGLVSLTAVSIYTTIGAGIFALPATVAQLLGGTGPLAYLAAGAGVLLIVSCFAELGPFRIHRRPLRVRTGGFRRLYRF